MKEEAFISFRKVWVDYYWLLPAIGIGRDLSEPLHRRYCIVITLWTRCLIIGWHYPNG